MDIAARRISANTLVTAASKRIALAEYVIPTLCAQRPTGRRSLTNSSLAKSRTKPPSQLQRNLPTPIAKRQESSSSSATSPPPRFSYGIAASFTAKDKRFKPKENVLHFEPYPIPVKKRTSRKARPASGQDAFFVSQLGDSGDVAMGVADGVGGWADSGVDPADFSHGLCDYMAYEANNYNPESGEALNAMALMQEGYNHVVNDKTIRAGGSTACVAIARTDGSLDVANLGDSGFLQLRLNAVHYNSEPQTHAFNTPYQLAIIPRSMRMMTQAFGGTQLDDMPKDSAVSKHSLRHGDVLVFATDGVWDNLNSWDILRLVSKLMVGSNAWTHSDDGIKVTERLSDYIRKDDSEGPDQVQSLQTFLAMGIASAAKAASINRRVDGPFAKEVQKHYPHEMWTGGKVDDICVVVAVVVEDGK
ncbi:hypothetical protein V496_07497 [Pseudogymnoascus sp. VKM F-4515 (FW-2607)]|nr:hypothetical protein V496_07497 [Pseudogymnoascus sp. VKM F-4515 (FW-2607)]KFY95802.1 hypothetical protein V498_03110 [Pseudogymnoascus sp. VKM F-4517 (FW-2822)]